ncbi:hypothetical protein B0T26DRAFT_671026 [Lasiosphaeria miniovina]|uniref:Uncharacterized protein n=1 Tax=Lasiosphaeria miniovina TaxID=1954250 RepID=A0AA40BIE7_9PEZI|nr:uncharacterized protein B0T26DRAFT_671026 [Lasiosphaeria miniovina]KAK0734785.1 hypothetical protein B0T26DRAFT_671026 [Lasiosphaeria miniovina]
MRGDRHFSWFPDSRASNSFSLAAGHAADQSPRQTIPPLPRSKSSKLRVDDPADKSLYCWQHKKQASLSARINTLVNRLGLITTQTNSPKPPRRQQHPPDYMSLILASESLQTASLLLAELAELVSQQNEAGRANDVLASYATADDDDDDDYDGDDGDYTPRSRSRGAGRAAEGRTKKSTGSKEKKILLKIGRATNVHRVLN